jgi:hypothetical protein
MYIYCVVDHEWCELLPFGYSLLVLVQFTLFVGELQTTIKTLSFDVLKSKNRIYKSSKLLSMWRNDFQNHCNLSNW